MYYVREDDRGNTRYITGPEEPHPIHVADVVILVRKYQQDNIAVVLDGQRSLHLTKVDERTGQLSQISADNNAQSTETENSGVQSVVEEVPQGVTVAPRNRPPVAVNKSAPHPEVHNLTSNGMHKDMHQEEHDGPDQPMSARPSRNKPRTIINVGTLGDTSHLANLSYESHEYVLFTPDSHSTSGTQEEWKQSKVAELHSIVVEHDSWEVLPKPTECNAVTAKWVNTIKNDGRRKSRFVARGFTQQQGIDYNETFSPVAKMATIRLFLSLVGILMLFTHQLDVKTAFLNAPMEEDVWVKPTKDLEELYIALAAQANPADKKKIN
jgi:hypothetical protein